jgi:hypothetical protein
MEQLWYYTSRQLHTSSMERKANHQLKMATHMHTLALTSVHAHTRELNQ